MDDVRLAFRRLVNRPAASIAGVLTLAFAIGAAAATWSLLSAVLLNPLPVRNPETLVVVGQVFTRGPGSTGAFVQGQPDRIYNAFVYAYYAHFRDSHVFEDVAAQWSTPAVFTRRLRPSRSADVGRICHSRLLRRAWDSYPARP